jgi:prepilin-type N-terminal cleavage/methylation domain-containing protein
MRVVPAVVSSPRAGFTLIELSIVLTVIGLLIGGILMGRSLLHAAEVRSVYTDAQRYITAIGYFSG